MWKTEVIGFLILFGIVFLLFVGGIFVFIFQYRKKKMLDRMEAHRMEEAHRLELLNAQLLVQRKTMTTIGQEIHDNVGQKLTLASLYAKQMSIRNGISNEKELLKIADIIDESLKVLRQLSKSLTQLESADRTLFGLLDTEAKRLNDLGVCHMKVEGNARQVGLSPFRRDAIYRILQEFLQNSLKHAACDALTIRIDYNEGRWEITAKDNGKGFDMKDVTNGIGLKNIKERVMEIGAAYSLMSNPGTGTILTVEFFSNEV